MMPVSTQDSASDAINKPVICQETADNASNKPFMRVHATYKNLEIEQMSFVLNFC